MVVLWRVSHCGKDGNELLFRGEQVTVEMSAMVFLFCGQQLNMEKNRMGFSHLSTTTSSSDRSSLSACRQWTGCRKEPRSHPTALKEVPCSKIGISKNQRLWFFGGEELEM